VTYCYTVPNDGDITLDTHYLVDDQLGAILSGFSYDLDPGAAVALTATVNITQTTINTATWTAYITGTQVTVSASDTATVTQHTPTGVMLTEVGNLESAAMSPLWLAVLLTLVLGMGILLFRRQHSH